MCAAAGARTEAADAQSFDVIGHQAYPRVVTGSANAYAGWPRRSRWIPRLPCAVRHGRGCRCAIAEPAAVSTTATNATPGVGLAIVDFGELARLRADRRLCFGLQK